MKWIISLAVVALVALLVFLQRGSTKSSYVNGLVPYNVLPNREYVLQRDCYLFKLTEQNTDWPLIGSHELVPRLPDSVSEKMIGAKIEGVRILDVVRTGTLFKLVSVRHDETRAASHITFEVLLLPEADRRYPRVDTFWLLDHRPEAGGQAPVFKPEFVAEHLRH